MTCFWDGIIKSLTNNEIKRICNSNKKITANKFAKFLKSKNKKPKNVLWQDSELTEKELQEHFDAVKELDLQKIGNGYLCSICDSYLLLLCELLEITIIHKYLNNVIIYKHKNNNRRTIKYKSTNGHFSIAK